MGLLIGLLGLLGLVHRIVVGLDHLFKLSHTIAPDKPRDNNPHSVAADESPPEADSSIGTSSARPGPAVSSVPAHVAFEDFVAPEHEGSESVQSRHSQSNGVTVPLVVHDGIQPDDAEDAIQDSSRNFDREDKLVNVAAVVRCGHLHTTSPSRQFLEESTNERSLQQNACTIYANAANKRKDSVRGSKTTSHIGAAKRRVKEHAPHDSACRARHRH